MALKGPLKSNLPHQRYDAWSEADTKAYNALTRRMRPEDLGFVIPKVGDYLQGNGLELAPHLMPNVAPGKSGGRRQGPDIPYSDEELAFKARTRPKPY